MVYVSGPYTGDIENNVATAVNAAENIVGLGFIPVVPHLLDRWSQLQFHPYEFWMTLCLAYLEKCDALLRLPGASPGANRECARAIELSIPICFTYQKLIPVSKKLAAYKGAQ